MIKFQHAFVAIGLIALVGCGPGDQSKEKKQSDADVKKAIETQASEQQLLADPSRAAPTLIQRLRVSVKMRDGLLMTDNQSLTRILSPLSETSIASVPGALNISAFPKETQWVVNCGLGITVVFGNPISGKSERVYGDGKVWLTTAPVSKHGCELLAPMIGKEIRTILNGG
jgi:hypothetical protein